MRQLLAILILFTTPIVRAQLPPLPANVLGVAREEGQSMANRAIARIEALAEGRTYTGETGLLIAEGDSWFDYPGTDVLTVLRWKYNYRIESAAHHGDTLEGMAYDDRQFASVASALRRVRDEKKVPRAVLLSAGGNDIAGPELAVMLNHRRSGMPAVEPSIANAIIGVRLRTYLISIISAIDKTNNDYFKKKIPIIVHGYDYPTPDGRGYLGGWWVLPGPWLEPSFKKKDHGDLARNTAAMKDLITRYNEMLKSIAGIPGFEHVRYVETVGTLSAQLGTYKNDWDNELHPTDPGFERIADRFARVLAELPAH